MMTYARFLLLTMASAALAQTVQVDEQRFGAAVTRQPVLGNPGTAPVKMQAVPSLALDLPAGEYTLYYLYGGWGQERQVGMEKLGPGTRSFTSLRGRSSAMYSPWFLLKNETTGVVTAGQLEWSGNWKMAITREPGTAAKMPREMPVKLTLGIAFDSDGPVTIDPGATLTLPRAVFVETKGGLDDAVNLLHKYQREHVFARTASNTPPLVQFNSWYPFPGKMTVAEMKRCANIAAETGAEVFVLDAGWYNKKDWSKELGDYEADRAAYPNGIEELSQHVRQLGMKFGIWVEIENAGEQSKLFAAHPDWFLADGGKPILNDSRHHLDFAMPQVREWARGVVDRLVKDYALSWIKIDYNIDAGSQFDSTRGDVLMRHILSYYGWLDEVRAAHPELVIENCSSGGLRFDLGILRHAHTTWLSDEVKPKESVQLGYGCTVEFSPEVCNHWMVGEAHDGTVDLTKGPGWWDFLFRVPMNGQFGISSRVFDWPPELRARAKENVALYKRLRPVIAGGPDVYHLTPPPAHNDPEGWMAIQYVAPGGARSVVMAYRLGNSDARGVLHLRGLAPGARYAVAMDGKPAGSRTTEELEKDGLPLLLDAEWRSAVVELSR